MCRIKTLPKRRTWHAGFHERLRPWRITRPFLSPGPGALSMPRGQRTDFLNSADRKLSGVWIYSKSCARPTGVVVIAQIDDKSIAELGRWPWPRDGEARLESALTDYKVAVVGFGVFFSERDSADVQREAIAQRLEREGVRQRTIQTTLGTSNDLAFANAIKAQGATDLDYALHSHYFLRQAKGDPSAYPSTFLSQPPLAYHTVRTQ